MYLEDNANNIKNLKTHYYNIEINNEYLRKSDVSSDTATTEKQVRTIIQTNMVNVFYVWIHVNYTLKLQSSDF